MIRELLRIYLMDIIFTGVSLYILFNNWEDDNISARTLKIIKWGLVLFLWINFTIPAIIDFIRLLTHNYNIITGEILNKDTRNLIRIFDAPKNRLINLVIMPNVLLNDVRVGDVVTVEYLAHGKYGKITEICSKEEEGF